MQAAVMALIEVGKTSGWRKFVVGRTQEHLFELVERNRMSVEALGMHC